NTPILLRSQDIDHLRLSDDFRERACTLQDRDPVHSPSVHMRPSQIKQDLALALTSQDGHVRRHAAPQLFSVFTLQVLKPPARIGRGGKKERNKGREHQRAEQQQLLKSEPSPHPDSSFCSGEAFHALPSRGKSSV